MQSTRILMLIFVAWICLFYALPGFAQCSICTKTASQLGEKPAAGLNSAILYLMTAPLAIIGIIGWRWWKSNRS